MFTSTPPGNSLADVKKVETLTSGGLMIKSPPANAGTVGFDPGLGRSHMQLKDHVMIVSIHNFRSQIPLWLFFF